MDKGHVPTAATVGTRNRLNHHTTSVPGPNLPKLAAGTLVEARPCAGRPFAAGDLPNAMEEVELLLSVSEHDATSHCSCAPPS